MSRDLRRDLTERPCIGPFCKLRDPAAIECLGHAGFDFCILDFEHGSQDVPRLGDLIRAAECAGMAPIVRIAEGRDDLIGAALDQGAAGVQIPQVGSAAAAERCLRLARFAPAGERGVCRFVRAAGYGSTERNQYFAEANQALVIIQIEGRQALDELDAILAVPGIDVVFIGPYDLSQSLGLCGQVDHPLVAEAVARVIAACKERGIHVGLFVEDAAGVARWSAAGAHYLSYCVDLALLLAACREQLSGCRQACSAVS